MPQMKDLTGIPFAWKGRTRHGCDCLGFASLMSERLSGQRFRLWDEQLEAYYQSHPEPPRAEGDVLSTAKLLLDRRDGAPMDGDVVVIRSARRECLATYFEAEGQRCLAAMFPSGSRVLPFERVSASHVVGVFSPDRIRCGTGDPSEI